MSQQTTTGWGRYPRINGQQLYYRSEEELNTLLQKHPAGIARGAGRAYGDSALAAVMFNSKHFNHIRAFDSQSGEITVEAGLLLDDLLNAFVPQGWFVPVTPGTRFVSIGGMVASDVHGKNHHGAGSFGRHITQLSLMLADGSIKQCSRSQNSELFQATIGGMGLTGIILTVSFRLMPIQTAWIKQETIRCANLDSVMDAFEDSQDSTYSVAWIDCLSQGDKLGRSVFYRGEHASYGDLYDHRIKQPLQIGHKKKRRIAFDFPAISLNRWTVRAFNSLYFHNAPSQALNLVDYDSFFYPLDSIRGWNRIYGKPGFVQYQCVLPKANSRDGLQQLLNLIASAGQGSFLAVLKLLGPQNDLLSFPMEGYTLALDFPVKPAVFALLDRLDQVVLEHGGRLYLTKDARMSRHCLQNSYPNYRQWQTLASQADPNNRWRSAQSQRLAMKTTH